MKVYKFGGASINSKERIVNTAQIIKNNAGGLMVIISAMGKTTNALEKVAEAFFANDRDLALNLFFQIKQEHLSLAEELLTNKLPEAKDQLINFFTEAEWLMHDEPLKSFDFYYDQIVCTGELMSTFIMSLYLQELNINCCWIDVRDFIRTDNNFRNANIDLEFTKERIFNKVTDLLKQFDVVVTQGFIGATADNESTTLGREGSDYTAAVFANLLNSESVTIWKDVDAVMNADPRLHRDAITIPALSYHEVIEMAYYGAQVIHPKTIKPLQNKNIPLFVKSFLNPSLPGTVISEKETKSLPPIIVQKSNQVLINFQSKDFSFVDDNPMIQLREIFAQNKTHPHLSQHTAISLLCCFDNYPKKIDKVIAESEVHFIVSIKRNLSLLTIRHYTESIIEKLRGGRVIVMEQRTPITIQMVLEEK
ncbi:MAG: aspartate kinase [Ferruginibacter sp.]|nr:aspartate kinase [Ferruginibacter sp.]